MTESKPPSLTNSGICRTCKHLRLQENRRGSHFIRCGLAEKDPLYRRYPQLPVKVCKGHKPEIGIP